MFGNGALHTKGFRPSSVPRVLRDSSIAQSVIVSALNCCALTLKIGLTLHFEGLSALHLELRLRYWRRLERALQTWQWYWATRDSGFRGGIGGALQWRNGFRETLPSHIGKFSRF